MVLRLNASIYSLNAGTCAGTDECSTLLAFPEGGCLSDPQIKMVWEEHKVYQHRIVTLIHIDDECDSDVRAALTA